MNYREALITVTEAARQMPENRPLTIALRVVDKRIERLREKDEQRQARRRDVEKFVEEAKKMRIKLAQTAIASPSFMQVREARRACV